MSLYCKGRGCERNKECLRAEAYREFSGKDEKEGFVSGLWFVREEECIREGFSDAVFPRKRQQ